MPSPQLTRDNTVADEPGGEELDVTGNLSYGEFDSPPTPSLGRQRGTSPHDLPGSDDWLDRPGASVQFVEGVQRIRRQYATSAEWVKGPPIRCE